MVLAERLTSQLLSGQPATSAEEVTRHLLAVQAQDARGARLAIRVRTSGLTAADIDRALDDRSLVISWLNRGTLHLVAATTTRGSMRSRRRSSSPRMRGGSSRKASPLPKPTGPSRSSSEASPSEGPLTRKPAPRADRADRRPHRGAGARPPPPARQPPRDRSARPDGRRRAGLSSMPRTGSARRLPSTGTGRSPSSPAGTSQGMRPPTTAISRNGPESRWAPREPVCRRSPPSSTRGPTGWSS